MTEQPARLEQMVARLKELNCRITPQRLAILKILAVSKGHPSVEEIYAQVKPDFPMTSLATVYKTVTLLKEAGEILEVSTRDGISRYDGSKVHPHPHIICTQCKAILDWEALPMKDLSQEIASKTGFRIQTHQVNFFGLCPGCQSASQR